MNNPTIIASERNWIDSRSVETLRQIAHFQGVQRVVGLPDLSVGHVPNGMAVATTERIYPHLIGGDIGCGMALYETAVRGKKIRAERFARHLTKLDSLYDIEDGEEPGCHLGTIGRGNHFAELHVVESVADRELFDALGIDAGSLYILVHSGSRAYGQIVFDRVSGSYEPGSGIDAADEEAARYLASHDTAIGYARESRRIIAGRLAAAIRIERDLRTVSDTAHNSITRRDGQWLHRKGATPTDQGAVMIAGSRGSLSYLVQPAADTAHSLHSLAHGAGRKWERNSARGKLSHKYTRSDLERTAIGSRVLCRDKALLYEEAPQAYKDIEVVIGDLVDAGLATVIASFRPILTYKD